MQKQLCDCAVRALHFQSPVLLRMIIELYSLRCDYNSDIQKKNIDLNIKRHFQKYGSVVFLFARTLDFAVAPAVGII